MAQSTYLLKAQGEKLWPETDKEENQFNRLALGIFAQRECDQDPKRCSFE